MKKKNFVQNEKRKKENAENIYFTIIIKRGFEARLNVYKIRIV